MLNFDFENKTKIIFGKDTELQVGELIKPFSKKVLLHYGGGSIVKNGLYDKVVNSLKQANIEYVELPGVVSNPRVSLVRKGIDLCRKENIDFILSVGGGSVIDSAKGIAAGYYYDGDVWDLYTKKSPFEKCLPTGVILTIPAAGSESSSGSVVTNEVGLWKKDIGSNNLRPVFAILNPELTYTLPTYQTTCGITDMIAHVMERYFTNVEAVALTDRLCEAIIKTVIEQSQILMENPHDYNARAEIMWSGTLAHNDLVGTGREGDWASHIIEHEVSGIYDLAHGAGLAIIFPAWMKYVYKHDIERFAQFANRVFNVEINTRNLEETALKGIDALETFFKTIGMPTRLSDANIDQNRIGEMAMKATNDDEYTVGSFVKLKKEDIYNIYRLAR